MTGQFSVHMAQNNSSDRQRTQTHTYPHTRTHIHAQYLRSETLVYFPFTIHFLPEIGGGPLARATFIADNNLLKSLIAVSLFEPFRFT